MYKKFRFSIPLITMLFSAFFFSCNKSSDAGVDLVPEGYLIKTDAVDTFKVLARTNKIDSLPTNNISRALLGTYIDPIFGSLKASFVTEITPTTVPSFGESPVFDSIVLHLSYDTVFGNNKAIIQELNIAEITERIRVDSTYYHNLDPATLNPIYFAEDFAFMPQADYSRDSILSIKLPYAFGEKLFSNASVWKDTTFATFFKGFLISPKNIKDASVSSFNLFHSDSKLSLYYHNTKDTLEFKFAVANTSARFNLFEHEYSSSPFFPYIDNPETQEDSLVYLQGAGGLKVKIDFPDLDIIKAQGLYGVNRAELTINADPLNLNSHVMYPPPTTVVLYALTDLGKLEVLYEYIYGQEYLGAKFTNNKYIFDISFITQQILSNKRKNNGFVLMVKDGSIIPSRIVLTSGKHSSPMKLALTLTKLK